MSFVSSSVGEQLVIPGFADYMDWNAALASAFFNSQRSGQLVYLDKDDAAFEAAYTSLGFESESDAMSSLATAVCNKLCWYQTGRSAFAEYDMLTKRWIYERNVARAQKKPVKAPPHIALLMMLSIAAERMQSSTTGKTVGEGSYYVQLERALQVPSKESKRLRGSFMESSEAYWEALSVWLEDHSGMRGLPSAYALMFRYVGLPISQALIRNTERRNIDRFFDEQGFIAGSSMSHAEMFAALDIWLTSTGGTANTALRQIWAMTGNQDRVTELALAQFSVWDGPFVRNIGGSSSSRGGRCLLTWRSERKFLTSVSKFGLVVTQGVPEDSLGSILAEDGSKYSVSFRPAGNNTYGVNFDGHVIEAQSLVGSSVVITTSEEHELRRVPKSIAIFARDALTASYVEVDRTVTGTETRILVKDDEILTGTVERILKDAAEPSYRIMLGGGKEGIPAGWVAFVDVSFLRAPNPELVKHAEVSAFQPRLATQMTLQGGLRLPGRTRRWSSAAPMSLVITSDENEAVDLYRIDRDPESLRTTDVLVREGVLPPLKFDLHKLAGGKSDFSLSLRRKSRILQNMQIKLRGTDMEDGPEQEDLRSIAHAVGTRLWPLTAVEDSDEATGWVMGTTVDARAFDQKDESGFVPSKLSWAGPKRYGKSRTKLRLPKPGQESCIITGKHRFIYPTFDGRYPKTPWMYGECDVCGMSRRSPTRIKSAVKRPIDQEVKRKPLAKVSGSNPTIDLRVLLDVMIYLGGGSRQDFSTLARQLEDSALFERQLLMSLESLAFIEVERDQNLEIVSWESAYQCISGLEDDSWVLTGPWSEGLVEEINEKIHDAGGITKTMESGIVDVLVFSGLTREALVAAAEDYVNEDVITARSARKLAETLPPLSNLVGELPRIPFPFAAVYEYFVVENAEWMEREFADIPGLYRLPRVFTSGYYLRTTTDIERGTGSRVWAELGKHLAANIVKRPLIAYDATLQQLRVPLGAELPGLYGRVAVTASGMLPVAEPRRNSVTYTSISPRTMSILSRKLMS